MDWINQEFCHDHAITYFRGSRTVHFCLSSKSTSSTSQPVTSTTGASSPLANGADANIVGQGSIGVAAGGKYQEEGATDLAGSNNAQIKGVDLTGASNITISDPSVDLATESLKTLSDALAQSQQQAVDATNVVGDALANTTPATNQPGLTDRVTAWLQSLGLNWYEIVGVLAVGGFAFAYLFRRARGKKG